MLSTAVGGRLNAMSEGQPIHVRTFGLALFLYAKGFRPLSAAGAVGDVVFIFPAEAASEMAQYRWAKEELVHLSKDIKGHK
jgi:hypothetical protein